MKRFTLALALAIAIPMLGAGTEIPSGEIASCVKPLQDQHPGKTGSIVLERGEAALNARAWLADKATRSISPRRSGRPSGICRGNSRA